MWDCWQLPRESAARSSAPLTDDQAHLGATGQRSTDSGALRDHLALLDVAGPGPLDVANRAVGLGDRALGRRQRLTLHVRHDALGRAPTATAPQARTESRN